MEERNPAIYLAQQEQVKEKVPTPHLGPLIDQQQTSFQNLLEEYKDICAESQTKIGRTHLIKHKIITENAEPTAQQAYRCNPKNMKFLREEIAKMEKEGIVQKSVSP